MFSMAPYFRTFRNALLMACCTSVGVVGCMVGPNFHTPAAPKTQTYTTGTQPHTTTATPRLGSAGQSQSFHTGQDIPAKWWMLFHSPALNELICAGLANSPNLAAAQAALRQAQETLTAQIGNSLFPAANLQLSATRQQLSTASPALNTSSIPVFSLYNASVNVSYIFDLFGGARRQVEAVRAQVDY